MKDIGTLPSRLGNLTGHWDGDTLVVETSGFASGELLRGQDLVVSGHTRVTERFTRLGPQELLFEFKIDDPTLYTTPWRGEMALHSAHGALYEYACHEGNYWMPSMLRAARMADSKPTP